MKRTLKIGVVQAKAPFSIEEGESNILKFVRKAKENKVGILGLPEDCVCGRFVYLEDYFPFDFLSKKAKKFNISLFGSNATLEGGRHYGTGFYIDNHGKVLSKVHKIILTKPEKETGFTVGKNYTPFPSFGNSLIVDRDNGFLKRGSEADEELLIGDVSVRTKEEIEKSYRSKWDPVKIPNIKISGS